MGLDDDNVRKGRLLEEELVNCHSLEGAKATTCGASVSFRTAKTHFRHDIV